MPDLKTLLTGIYEEHQKLDGELVVAEAANPQHPLHGRFEWDDSVAGHKYRVIQAERMIRAIKIETAPPSEDDGPHYVRAFVSNHQIAHPTRTGYSPIDEVVQDDVAYQMLLRAFKRQVNEMHRRYGHLKEYRAIMFEQSDGFNADTPAIEAT